MGTKIKSYMFIVVFFYFFFFFVIDEREFLFFFFFFQAEDGIRDFHETGVQTCALPISTPVTVVIEQLPWLRGLLAAILAIGVGGGRAWCRRRVWVRVVAVSLKKKI